MLLRRMGRFQLQFWTFEFDVRASETFKLWEREKKSKETTLQVYLKRVEKDGRF